MAPRASLLRLAALAAGLLAVAMTPGCLDGGHGPAADASEGGGDGAAMPTASPPAEDLEALACEARWRAIERGPAEPGTPGFEARRVAILGRARGPALLFTAAPRETDEAMLPPVAKAAWARMKKDPPGVRVARLRGNLKHDPASLRAILLREGRAYTEEPLDAFELVERVTLTDLFTEPRLVHERGGVREVLLRQKQGREERYVRARDGRPAQLLLGDRVVVEGEDLGPVTHLDVGAFADAAGFDRVKPVHVGPDAVLAELRIAPAGNTVRAVLERKGADLALGCLAEPREVREAAAKAIDAEAWRRRSISAMRASIEELVFDQLPFDRPREFEGPDRDGELRPHWASAYFGGRHTFRVDDVTYPVFTPDGRPFPPTVCVDFVLDTWERAGGRWYRPRDQPRGRTPGRVDFDAEKIENRRGVLGFGAFAAQRPDLFEHRTFAGAERVPFAERERYFAGLVPGGPAASDLFRPGDVVAIQGLKRDDRIHQHAILVESVDPVSGLPHGLADQMKRPRRRTWEGIMAEAPKRSLLYRARPTRGLLERLGEGEPPVVAGAPTP